MTFGMFESLESRRMLSADVDADGVLVITGTSSQDRVIIFVEDNDSVLVTVNGVSENFDVDEFPAGIRVSAMGGKDKVAVDETNGALGASVTMYGGNGKDDLYGGSSADK